MMSNPSDWDQAFPSMPPVQYQLERLKTHLYWIEEECLDCLSRIDAASDMADKLRSAIDSASQGKEHLKRLSEIISGEQV